MYYSVNVNKMKMYYYLPILLFLGKPSQKSQPVSLSTNDKKKNVPMHLRAPVNMERVSSPLCHVWSLLAKSLALETVLSMNFNYVLPIPPFCNKRFKLKT